MKFGSCLLAFCLLVPGLSHADGLSEADKQKLLDTLENILHGNESQEDKAIREAIKVLASVSMDESAASDLYEKSYKKVNFEDKEIKDKEWRDWKDKNKDRLSSSAFKRILKYQCQWGVVTLQAAKIKDENPDFSRFSDQALSLLNTIASDYKDLKKFRGDMQGNILNGPVGNVLKVNGVQAPKWPGSIFDVNAVFQSIIFPQYRNAADVSGLRSAWKKRLALQLAFSTTKEEEAKAFSGDDKKKKSSAIKHPSGDLPASKNDLSEGSVKAIDHLRWECEKDCYKIGDEAAASANMLLMIRSVKDAREQNRKIQELVAILSGETTDEDGINSFPTNSGASPSTRPVPSKVPAKTGAAATAQQSATAPKFDDSDFVYDGPVPKADDAAQKKPVDTTSSTPTKVVEITNDGSTGTAAQQASKPPVEVKEQPKTVEQKPAEGKAKKDNDDFFGDE